MKRFLGLSVFAALALTSTAAFAADDCAKITATGHPQYPVIAYQAGRPSGRRRAHAGRGHRQEAQRSARIEIHGELGRCPGRRPRRQGRHDLRHLLQRRAGQISGLCPARLHVRRRGDLRRQGQGVPVQGPGRSDRQEGRHQSRRELRHGVRCLHQGQARRRPRRRHRRRVQGPVGGKGRLSHRRLLSGSSPKPPRPG